MYKNVILKQHCLFLSSIAVLILIVDMISRTYRYYELSLAAVCALSIYVAVMSYKRKEIWAAVIFVLMAALVNPANRIMHISPDMWQAIYLVCAVLFAIMAFILRPPKEN